MKKFTGASGILLGFIALEKLIYYGFRALLFVYLMNFFPPESGDSYLIYGLFFSAAFAAPMVAGWVIDQFSGYSWGMILGTGLTAIGIFMTVIPAEIIIQVGLGLIVTGTSFSRTASIGLMGNWVQPRRWLSEGMFSLIYLVVNIGAFLGTVYAGLWDTSENYMAALIILAIIALLVSAGVLLLFLFGLIPVPESQSRAIFPKTSPSDSGLGAAIGFAAMVVIGFPISLYMILGADWLGLAMAILLALLVICSFGLLLILGKNPQGAIGILWVMVLTTIFWLVNEMRSSYFMDASHSISESYPWLGDKIEQIVNLVTVSLGVGALALMSLLGRRRFSLGHYFGRMGLAIGLICISFTIFYFAAHSGATGALILTIFSGLFASIGEVLLMIAAYVAISQMASRGFLAAWLGIYLLVFSVPSLLSRPFYEYGSDNSPGIFGILILVFLIALAVTLSGFLMGKKLDGLAVEEADQGEE